MSKIHHLNQNQDLGDTDFAQLAAALKPAAIGNELRAGLKRRVLHAAFESRAPSMSVVRAEEGKWVDFASGIRIKPLRVDLALRTHTSLWRLAPGSCLPAHPHSADEECLVIEGALDWEARTYRKGDYLLARAVLHHTEISSPGGAVILIRGELTAKLESTFAVG